MPAPPEIERARRLVRDRQDVSAAPRFSLLTGG
jgi:hypothetical protein